MIAVLLRAHITIQHSLLKQQASADLSYVIKYLKNLEQQGLNEQATMLLAIGFVLMGLIVQDAEEAKRFFDEGMPYCYYTIYF